MCAAGAVAVMRCLVRVRVMGCCYCVSAWRQEQQQPVGAQHPLLLVQHRVQAAQQIRRQQELYTQGEALMLLLCLYLDVVRSCVSTASRITPQGELVGSVGVFCG
jgi:hypothetical protein